MIQPRDEWVPADFNGIFGDHLCLSHGDTVQVVAGGEMALRAGLILTAAEPDPNVDGQPDWLVATGVVEPSPDWLQCNGSRWVLRFDADGVYHLSEKTSP